MLVTFPKKSSIWKLCQLCFYSIKFKKGRKYLQLQEKRQNLYMTWFSRQLFSSFYLVKEMKVESSGATENICIAAPMHKRFDCLLLGD